MVTGNGTLAPVGCPDFNQYLVRRLHNPHLVRPRPPSDSRGYDRTIRAPSASNQRARLGFKYWIDDNVKVRARTKSGNDNASHETLFHVSGHSIVILCDLFAAVKSMGSKGTFLGIGEPRL